MATITRQKSIAVSLSASNDDDENVYVVTIAAGGGTQHNVVTVEKVLMVDTGLAAGWRIDGREGVYSTPTAALQKVEAVITQRFGAAVQQALTSKSLI